MKFIVVNSVLFGQSPRGPNVVKRQSDSDAAGTPSALILTSEKNQY